MPIVNRARAHQLLTEASVDVAIATSPDNVRYVSDYDCVSQRITPSISVFGIMPRDAQGSIGLVVPSLEVDAWAAQPNGVDDVLAYGTLYRDIGDKERFADDDARIIDRIRPDATYPGSLEALKSVIERQGYAAATIGVDETSITRDVWDAILALFPKAKIVPAGELFRRIRMVKTFEEIRRLEHSAQITEEAIRATYELVQAGTTEQELAACFKAEVALRGGTAQFWVVSGGRRTAHTHPHPSGYALAPGDLLKLDVGCTYQGYWSDIGRTRVIGDATERQAEIHGALLAGLRAASETLRPGVRPSQVFEAAVATVREAGISTYKRHHCGHGIGISVYDSPIVQARQYSGIYGFGHDDPLIEPGMVINLETPYYLLGDFGMIVEDTFVVEERGIRQITSLDHSFQHKRAANSRMSHSMASADARVQE